ncbi:hypothetical protein [Paracoccus saliphilus]|uniref:Uncharacterized protein n=1 Tax=Paracoccus saliphilus TaxID=405559 RepID=A0AA45W4M6_9RHOB|nr:hypothetical protein [Paracoccus saliphilus]WCR04568.1 hypothetical protein JHX88_07575 [Paracoccus saliphilus]SIS86893.1 hypothetical protein SAMN05421772_10724 [Paracoccus saliphilus]
MALKHRPRANGIGLPAEWLAEIHDLLTLALDATERAAGYSPAEREYRSYTRAALRRVNRIMEGEMA